MIKDIVAIQVLIVWVYAMLVGLPALHEAAKGIMQ
jgi:hypothetical protein